MAAASAFARARAPTMIWWSPQRLAMTHLLRVVVNWAPQSVGTAAIARQVRTAAAMASPVEPAVATPHDPSRASVTTASSSRSTALAGMGLAIKVPKASTLPITAEARDRLRESMSSSIAYLAAHAGKWFRLRAIRLAGLAGPAVPPFRASSCRQPHLHGPELHRVIGPSLFSGPNYLSASATPETIKATLTSLWNCRSVSRWKMRRPTTAPATPGSA